MFLKPCLTLDIFGLFLVVLFGGVLWFCVRCFSFLGGAVLFEKHVGFVAGAKVSIYDIRVYNQFCLSGQRLSYATQQPATVAMFFLLRKGVFSELNHPCRWCFSHPVQAFSALQSCVLQSSLEIFFSAVRSSARKSLRRRQTACIPTSRSS